MKVDLTLMVQIEIDAQNEKSYDRQRDSLISQLEGMGFTVDIESEDEADDGEDDE